LKIYEGGPEQQDLFHQAQANRESQKPLVVRGDAELFVISEAFCFYSYSSIEGLPCIKVPKNSHLNVFI
jgi:hypothetical protein